MVTKTFSQEADFISEAIVKIKEVCSTAPNSKLTYPYSAATSTKSQHINIALSGGSTPKNIYKALSRERLPWGRIHFHQVDERYIPNNHKDSNRKLISTTLFKHTPHTSPNSNPKNFHFFDTTLPISEALEKYEKSLPKSFDLTILGIGTDGHTASIFPDSIISKSAKVAHTQVPEHIQTSTLHQSTSNRNPVPPIKDRLTITFPVILKSKNILVLLKGQEKENVITLSPANQLLKHKKLEVYFCS